VEERLHNDIPKQPSWIELESVRPMSEVERITSLSADTIGRRYPEKIVDLSPRRRGMKLRDILDITSQRRSK
jgi:hypothetical protein